MQAVLGCAVQIRYPADTQPAGRNKLVQQVCQYTHTPLGLTASTHFTDVLADNHVHSSHSNHASAVNAPSTHSMALHQVLKSEQLRNMGTANTQRQAHMCITHNARCLPQQQHHYLVICLV
jgi:hypothetical protein